MNYDNMEGKFFNKLEVIKRKGYLGTDKAYLCKCECGNEKVIRARNIFNGDTKSCGCIRRQFEDLSGRIYNNWRVNKFIEVDSVGETAWECECLCENKTIKIIKRRTLIRNACKSCGCLPRATPKKYKQRKDKKDKLYKKLYSTWYSMKTRCYDVNHKEYKNYGGRGIFICEEWLNSFKTFYEWSITNGSNLQLTIDRKDVNKGYYPENCRWIDNKTQQNNRRNNVLIEFNNKTQTLAQWEDELGFSKKSLSKRLKRGWSIERALTTKTKKRNKKEKDDK